MNFSHPPSRLLARAPPTPSPASTATAFRLRPSEPPAAEVTLNEPPLIAINPAFLPDAVFPGSVQLIVEGITLYAHKEILVFSSPFFETLLTGSWRETASETSTWPGDRASIRRDSLIAPQPDLPGESDDTPLEPAATPFPPGSPPSEHLTSPELEDGASPACLSPVDDVLESATLGSFVEALEEAQVEVDFDQVAIEAPGQRRRCDARIRLVEEKASAVQDLLAFCYPHLECSVSWVNVADLLAMSAKFLMPLLKRRCIDFLMASAAGKPIHAIKLAEEYTLPELYKEASRFLLDTFPHLTAQELAILSPETLLKIERRRNYFLERLLKLGLVDPARDYVCCASCPNPQVCARLVHEKWTTAWAAAFRFGPPQPSIVYRSLRQLEPSLSSPALHLPHTSCQNHARAFVADLFDRMFSLGVRPVSGAFGNSMNATRVISSVNHAHTKYFLSIHLDA